MSFRRGILTLLAAASISSCDQPPVNPVPTPTPNPDCIEGSARDYASVKELDLDVSTYDTNTNRYERGQVGEQCFTVHERTMIDTLTELINEGAHPETLQQIIDDHPNVGPITPWALRKSWDATLKDQEHDTDLEFYTTVGQLGWVALDNATGVSLPGSWVREAGINTPYPIDESLQQMTPPDWNRTEGEAVSFLAQLDAECTSTSAGQSYPEVTWQSSADVGYSTEIQGTPIPIRTSLPPGAYIEQILISQRTDPAFGPYSDGYISIGLDIHPDDTPLIGFSEVFEYAVHLVPSTENYTTDPDNWLFTKEDFPVQEGERIDENTILGYQNLRVGSTGPVYDFTIFVRERKSELENTTPYVTSIGAQSLDVLAGYFLKDLGIPRNLTAPPTEPRYANVSVFGCENE